MEESADADRGVHTGNRRARGSGRRHPVSRVRRRIGAALAALIFLGLAVPAVLAIPVVIDILPQQEIASCTVGNPPVVRTSGRGRSLAKPRLSTDCGQFRLTTRQTRTACTIDTMREVALVSGKRYDLVVRGPRIPLLASPTLVSAKLSAEQAPAGAGMRAQLDEQRAQLDALLEGLDPEDRAAFEATRTPLAEGVDELEARFSAEALRAFDYLQPPYDPRCDVVRDVMTTEGIQAMDPVRAEEVLRVPAGVTPRSPRLPCEGYFCGPLPESEE